MVLRKCFSNTPGRLLAFYISLFFLMTSNIPTEARFSLLNIQMDNCCLHHKETLKKPEVASLVITAFVDNGTSLDQANKVRIYQCYNLIHRTHPSFLSLTVAWELYLWCCYSSDVKSSSLCPITHNSISNILPLLVYNNLYTEHQWVFECMFACALLYTNQNLSKFSTKTLWQKYTHNEWDCICSDIPNVSHMRKPVLYKKTTKNWADTYLGMRLLV